MPKPLKSWTQEERNRLSGVDFLGFEPFQKDADYDIVKHVCGGVVVDFMGLKNWVCDCCHKMWPYDRLDLFSADALADRFWGKRAPEQALDRLVWVREGSGLWHLEGTKHAVGDAGVLPDGREWRKVVI